MFQSSFELTGYITSRNEYTYGIEHCVSKLFRAYGLYNNVLLVDFDFVIDVSKLFRAYGLYNSNLGTFKEAAKVSKLFRAYGLYNNLDNSLTIPSLIGFKALSSLRVI